MVDFDHSFGTASKQTSIGSLWRQDLRDLELRILISGLGLLNDGLSSSRPAIGHRRSKWSRLVGTYTDQLWADYHSWLSEELTTADLARVLRSTNSGSALESTSVFSIENECDLLTSSGLVSGVVVLPDGIGVKSAHC